MNPTFKSRCCDAGEVAAMVSQEDLDFHVRILRALGHPVRLRMVDLIHEAGGEICVCEFEQYFELKQPTISHHLKILRDAGVIRSRQDASWVRHSIDPRAFTNLRELAASFERPAEPG